VEESHMSEYSPVILFLIGASGVGKTTIVKTIQANTTLPATSFFYSDAEKVPSIDGMLEQAGSLERYQELLTHRHVKTITENYSKFSTIIFEGQARFSFIEDACNMYGVKQYKIILIDCTWKDMRCVFVMNENNQS
jgi:adenylate kinase family enzyme